MNRNDRRKIASLLKKERGYGGSVGSLSKVVKAVLNIQQEQYVHLEEGERVKLDVDYIESKNGFSRLNEAYKEFVHGARDRVFTVHLEGSGNKSLISLLEDQRWLFQRTEVIKVDDEVKGGDSVLDITET